MLLNQNGFNSFILPSSFAKEKYGKLLREYIVRNFGILQLVDFQNHKIFKNVARQYMIYIITKNHEKRKQVNKYLVG